MKRQEELNEAWCKYMGKCSTEIMQALAFALRWCDEHPNWISVEDELPPKESEYEDNSIDVLATDGNFVYKGLYQSSEFLWGWFTNDFWALDNVTHWMPLPAPPHHIIDANKKIDRVIGTADHIKTALDVLNKKGGEDYNK